MKLDWIANVVTQTKRPGSILLEGDAKPPQGWLVKREHSDGARHVKFPKTRKDVVDFDRGSYRWIGQQMAPLLRKWGEYRVIFVDQKPLYAIITTPKSGAWLWCPVMPYSLQDLR
jgi:hypothetical protein